MILVISHSKHEQSTDEVIDWLDYLGADYSRINGDDLLQNGTPFRLDLGREATQPSNTLIPADKVNAVWMRRWRQGDIIQGDAKEEIPPSMEHTLYLHLLKEFGRLTMHFFTHYNEAYWLTDFSALEVNKLNMLERALNRGVDIPATIITNNKKDLKDFLKTHKRIISKPIGDVGIFNLSEKELFTQYVEEITEDTVDELPETFFPSLFQERLDKAFEYRIFYLDGKFYPMAMFSQANEKTVTDFRHYDTKKPNRRQPAVLSPEMMERLTSLMHDLNQNTGSIDIVLTKDGRNVFLEVNPVGQFAALSVECNYNLNKKIAEHLIAKDHEYGQRKKTSGKTTETVTGNLL